MMFAAIRFGIKAFGIFFTASVYFDWFCASDFVILFCSAPLHICRVGIRFLAVLCFGTFHNLFLSAEATLVNRFAALTRLRINIDIEKSDDL